MGGRNVRIGARFYVSRTDLDVELVGERRKSRGADLSLALTFDVKLKL